jgi:hypothetical protein
MDRRTFLGATVLAGLSASLTAKPGFSQTYNTQNLIIIGWDGVGIDTLTRVMNQGRLPVLSNFISDRGCTNPKNLVFLARFFCKSSFSLRTSALSASLR